MSLMQRSVLVLNATYEPINICAARRAIALVMNGIAHVVEPSGLFARHGRGCPPIQIPSVVRLFEYRRVPFQTRSVSRKNILIRDRHKCQYCGHGFAAGALTLDHVMPRSRAGASNWENLVACCFPCNNRKGNKTPDEAAMPLLSRPSRFSLHAKQKAMQVDESWSKYMFY